MCSTSFLKFCLEAELELKIAFTVVRKSILVIFEKNLSWFIFVCIGKGQEEESRKLLP